MIDNWETKRRASIQQNIAGILKVYGRDPAEKQVIMFEFLRAAALDLSFHQLRDRNDDDVREALISSMELLVDQLKEEDESILDARSQSDGADGGQPPSPRWQRAWPRPQGGSMKELVARHLDTAAVRFAPNDLQGELHVYQAYVEEIGTRMWKANHAYEDSAQRAVLAGQLDRLARLYAHPPAYGQAREP